MGMRPNKRVQDGLKAHWLCSDCEGLFAAWETKFANLIFRPITEGRFDRLPYQAWMLKFCASVSWRVLLYCAQVKILSHFSAEQQAQADLALRTWREFLVGERPHPEQFEQHVIAFDIIESASFELPANINRYLLRGVEFDAACGKTTAFTFSKLGPIGLVGFINVSQPRQWEGSKIAVRSGHLGPRQYTLPRQFGEYLVDRANRHFELSGSISEKQQDKINETIRANIDKYASSDAFRALRRDVEMFGGAAFNRETKPKVK